MIIMRKKTTRTGLAGNANHEVANNQSSSLYEFQIAQTRTVYLNKQSETKSVGSMLAFLWSPVVDELNSCIASFRLAGK